MFTNETSSNETKTWFRLLSCHATSKLIGTVLQLQRVCVCRFLTAHQHTKGHLVPCNG